MNTLYAILRYLLGFVMTQKPMTIESITAPMASILKDLDNFVAAKIDEAEAKEVEAARLTHACDCAREEAQIAANLIDNYKGLVVAAPAHNHASIAAE